MTNYAPPFCATGNGTQTAHEGSVTIKLKTEEPICVYGNFFMYENYIGTWLFSGTLSIDVGVGAMREGSVSVTGTGGESKLECGDDVQCDWKYGSLKASGELSLAGEAVASAGWSKPNGESKTLGITITAGKAGVVLGGQVEYNTRNAPTGWDASMGIEEVYAESGFKLFNIEPKVRTTFYKELSEKLLLESGAQLLQQMV